MKVIGISTDKLNERLLKAADVLRPLGIGILTGEAHSAVLESGPKGVSIKNLTVDLEFWDPEPSCEKESTFNKPVPIPNAIFPCGVRGE